MGNGLGTPACNRSGSGKEMYAQSAYISTALTPWFGS